MRPRAPHFPARIRHVIFLVIGLDHKRLRYHRSGRDYRLTDVYGCVAMELLA